MQVKVGTHLKHTVSMPYKDHGKEGIHHLVTVVEVTSIKGDHAEFKTVEVLEESGIPSWGSRPLETTGGFSISRSQSFQPYGAKG